MTRTLAHLAHGASGTTLERFTRRNADSKAQGERLESAIRAIDAAHVGPVPLRAELIRANLPPPSELGRGSAPSLNSVQRHLRKIRSARNGGG